MQHSARAQYFYSYDYGYPGTAYYYSPYSYPGYSHFYYSPYSRPYPWHENWGHGGWDRHWEGHGWDHGGWHNSGRGQQAHGGERGGGRAFPNSESIARGNQFRDFLFRNFH
jgi:hypothetical protein